MSTASTKFSRPKKLKQSLAEQVDYELTGYMRQGSYDNRDLQRQRIDDFIEHCRLRGVRSIGQIGKKHVNQFWKTKRHLADSTLKQYWYAIKKIWEVGDLRGEPPKPFTKAELEMREEIEASATPVDADLTKS